MSEEAMRDDFDGQMMRRLVDDDLAQKAHALADAIEDQPPAVVRVLLDAIAVAQGTDLNDLHEAGCDSEYEARVWAVVEAADRGPGAALDAIGVDF